MRNKLVILFISVLVLTSGCATYKTNMPLIFSQSHTVGVSIGGKAADQGVDLTVGYKDSNFAIVPATVKQSNGDSTLVKSTAGQRHQDALSVLGQFEVNTDGKQVQVGLGKFFATGLAAKRLADGFAHKLGYPKETEEQSERSTPENPE